MQQQKACAILVDARPEPLSVAIERCAVLVIDMQSDFAARGGMFDRAGIDISVIEAVVAPTARTLAAARAAAIPVIYLKMQHSQDLSDTGGVSGPHWIKHQPLAIGTLTAAPNGSIGRCLIEGTWNTEILPQLAPEAGDIVVAKHRYSGFFETRLDQTLRGKSIQYLIITGCTTSICVESTVRDAMYRGYHCLLLEDCTAEPIAANLSRSNHEASLLTIQLLFGWVSDSKKFISSLARRGQAALER